MSKENELIIKSNGDIIPKTKMTSNVVHAMGNGTLSVSTIDIGDCFVGKGKKIVECSGVPQKCRFLSFSTDVEVISDDACSKLEDIIECDVPSSVHTIGERAFLKCYNLERIILREGLKEIGDGAFQGCLSLENPLIIPSTVKKIGKKVFNGSSVYALKCSEEFAEMYSRQARSEKALEMFVEKGDYICVYNIDPLKTTPRVRKHFYKITDKDDFNKSNVISNMHSYNKKHSEYIGSCLLDSNGNWEKLKFYGPAKGDYAGNEKEFNKLQKVLDDTEKTM